jgi:SAM-dependent methyltransferase
MRNPELWKPTKFVLRRGRLRASLDRKECAVASRLAVDRTAAIYAAEIPRHCRGRLLDLGCGYVPLHGVYAPHVSASVCVDWPKTIHRSPNLDVECDLSARLPFADGSFDTLILSDVLEHVPDPALLWREMARVLRARGKLLLNVPFFYRIHEAPHDYYRYTEFALRRFAEQVGFDVVVLQAIGGIREVLGDLIAKRLERRPLFGKPLAIALQAACFRIGNTKFGAKKTAKTGRVYPLAYFLVAERRA